MSLMASPAEEAELRARHGIRPAANRSTIYPWDDWASGATLTFLASLRQVRGGNVKSQMSFFGFDMSTARAAKGYNSRKRDPGAVHSHGRGQPPARGEGLARG